MAMHSGFKDFTCVDVSEDRLLSLRDKVDKFAHQGTKFRLARADALDD